MSWLNYLICFGCFLVGKLQAAFSIIIPMICVNFALPFTKEIEQNTGASTTSVRKKIRSTITIWAVINFLAFLVIYSFVPLAYSLAYAIGVLLTVFNIGQTKKNPANINDYYTTYLKYFPAEHKNRIDLYFKEEGYIQ